MEPSENILTQLQHKQKHSATTTLTKDKTWSVNGKKFKFQYFMHGKKPKNGYRLVIGLHGGGGMPADFNQKQWNNHKHLYDGHFPSGTIWFVPRSAEDSPDMWWKDYVVNFILGIIKCFNIIGQIDPNQVFLTGYSAGGDGVYQLAGALADLLAGAAVMGGHPNKSNCYNLRNIAFSIQVGQKDNSYDRANWAKVYINKIKQLQIEYQGFQQYSQVHKDQEHWMNQKDAWMFPKFMKQVRNPYPDFIMFRQHPRAFRKTFYYIRVPQKHQGLICVRKDGNKFEIQSQQNKPVYLMINSRFVDFNQEVIVNYNGKQTIATPTKRENFMKNTAQQYFDKNYIFEDQILCEPGKIQLKDQKVFRPFRPYALENDESSWNKIQQIQKGVAQDKKLNVFFTSSMNKQLVDEIKATQKEDKKTNRIPSSQTISHVEEHHQHIDEKNQINKDKQLNPQKAGCCGCFEGKKKKSVHNTQKHNSQKASEKNTDNGDKEKEVFISKNEKKSEDDNPSMKKKNQDQDKMLQFHKQDLTVQTVQKGKQGCQCLIY